ncbi:MAG: TM1266 family iron-only hydrogenase system putative regulator [Chloroflexota bacterium]
MTGIAVIGMIVEHRAENAPGLQEVLTRHGSRILARMGVRSPDKEEGIISLIVEGGADDVEAVTRDVGAVEGVTVTHMMLR